MGIQIYFLSNNNANSYDKYCKQIFGKNSILLLNLLIVALMLQVGQEQSGVA